VFWWKGFFVKESSFNFSVLPNSEQDKALKMQSFITASKDEIAQYVLNFYNKDESGAAISVKDPTYLENIYYSLGTLHNISRLNLVKGKEDIFEKIRSYYNPDKGYYSEENIDPVFSTMQALKIDRWFSEDLEKDVNMEWVGNNSLENETIEEGKISAEYQAAVVEIYENADFTGKMEKMENLSNFYFERYCGITLSENLEPVEYLKEKYNQLYIISKWTGVEDINIEKLGWECLKGNFSEEKKKLDSLEYKDLEGINEIYWLYFLKKAHGLETDIERLLERVERFYINGGFKENLKDKKPTLKGTYYGTLFIK
jgi:hypothetical protein